MAVAVVIGSCFAVGFVWYFFSPEYTDVGYRPIQPVPYSHKVHAGDLSIDCRYCHTSVENQAHANVPPTRTCMNCHNMVNTDSDSLALVRASFVTGEPIEWIRVHNLPDFAYFEHSPHIRAGVGCISCHGDVTRMEVIMLSEPLSMGWCLECHRNPDPHLRPVSEVTNMNWQRPPNHVQWLADWKESINLKPPIFCSGCHR
jgi:hypothetical protein